MNFSVFTFVTTLSHLLSVECWEFCPQIGHKFLGEPKLLAFGSRC